MLFFKADCQEPNHWKLSEVDGLPSSIIYKIIQAEDGLIWLATENGVCSYNGKKFKCYEAAFLKDNTFIEIFADPFNRIWAFNLSGQLVFIENEVVQNFPLNDKFPESTIERIAHDENSIWMGVHSGKSKHIVRVEFDKEQLFHNFAKLDDASYHARGFDTYDGQLYYFRFDGKKRFITLCTPNGKGQLFSRTLLPGDKDYWSVILWGEQDGLFYNKKNIWKADKNSKVLILHFDDRKINKIIAAQSNYLLTTKGFYKFSGWEIPGREHAYFEQYKINTLCVDREENIWLGTSGEGVLVIPNLESMNYTKINSALPDKKVFAIHQLKDQDKLLLGHGMNFLSVVSDSGVEEVVHLPYQRKVNQIDFDWEGLLWVVTDDGLFFGENHKAMKLVVSSSYKSIDFSDEANLLLGTYNKCYKLRNRFPEFTGGGYPVNDAIANGRTYAVLNDLNGTSWFGNAKGLFQYNDDKVEAFLMPYGTACNYSVLEIVQSAEDSLIWVGTSSHGVLGIKDNKLFYHYNTKNGLANNNVKDIVIKNKTLWIATNAGVHKINYQANKISKINLNDGLPSNEILSVNLLNDKLWVGTASGLTSIAVSSIRENNVRPLVHLEGITISAMDTVLLENYELEHDENDIVIRFNGMSFRDRGKTTFRYKMKGVKEHTFSSESGEVIYRNLAPGNYHFQVWAVNDDKVESAIPAECNFYIKTPWWKTSWFLIMLTLGFVGLVGTGFYLRFRQLQKREIAARAIEDKIRQLKQDALQNQMNPHFIFNALNAIQKYIISNEKEEAMNYLAQLSTLIRRILEYSKEKLISLEQEIDFLKLYLGLEEIRFQDKVNIQLSVDPTLVQNASLIFIPPLIIQPIVENAFKHGLLHKTDKGNLKVEFKPFENYLNVLITDDGVGRAKAIAFSKWKTKHTSTGLATTKARLDLYNNTIAGEKIPSGIVITDIKDAVGNPAGTKVSLFIRISEN